MELAEPSIEVAYGKCVEQGANLIIVHPFFLSQGRHVQEDVPQLVQAASVMYPKTSYRITPPLGAMQAELVQLIAHTIDSTIAEGN